MAKISELKGRRILYRTPASEQLREGVVEELSEGGNVRIGDAWHPQDHVRVVEELPKVKAPKAEKAVEVPVKNATAPATTSSTPPPQ
jgi:hypothetical protein